MKKENNFTKTVIFMDLFFFVVYTPWSIWYMFNRVSASTPSFQSPLISAYLNLIQSITFSIAALNNGDSFFLNLTFNTLFRKELLALFNVSSQISRNSNSNSNSATLNLNINIFRQFNFIRNQNKIAPNRN